MKESIRKYVGLGVCLFVLFLAVTYWEKVTDLLGLVARASRPLLLGCVIAYIVNLLMRFYEDKMFSGLKNHALKRGICILLALASVAVIIVLVVWMILPELWASIQLLFSEVPDLLKRVIDYLEQEFGFNWSFLDNIFLQLENLDWQNIAKNIVQNLGGVVGTAMSMVGTVTGVIVDFVVALIFAVYVLAGKETLGHGIRRLMDCYLKSRHRDRILYILRTLDRSFSKFIIGQCVEAVILGGLCIIGMMVLRIPYATMVGTLIGFTALIPVAGAYIGGIVGVLLIATVSPVKAIIFVVFLIILQQLEGNLIYPRVVGNSIGLPGIWVLAAITVGGGVMGVMGMLLGVPLVAALYQIILDDLKRRERFEPLADGPAPTTESIILPANETARPAQKSSRKK